MLTDRGEPFANTNSFGNIFRTWCEKAGVRGSQPTGCGDPALPALAEAGANEREIMAVTAVIGLRRR